MVAGAGACIAVAQLQCVMAVTALVLLVAVVVSTAASCWAGLYACCALETAES